MDAGMNAQVKSGPTYDDAPRIVIWEVTRACALACKHCRAEALPHRSPLELTTQEALAFVDQVTACGRPLFILTGGDPLMRDDVYDIAAYASTHGLPVAISPSATGRLTKTAAQRLGAAGVRRASLSIDAPDAERHDAFRGVKGSFARTLAAVEDLRSAGVSVQVNTTLSTFNIEWMDEFEELMAQLDVALWSVFFALPVGRANFDLCLDAEQTERAYEQLAEIAARNEFHVKTTEGPAYRRYLAQHGEAPPRTGIADGRGFVFISRHGDVYPSGFLPLRVGNVRETPLLDLYRGDPIMQRLRRPETFEGKCGVCEFRMLCGGSRARAFAYSGDPFGSDPACNYIPPSYRRSSDIISSPATR
jgi:radical SAM protein with 4Fe4S-binding SPASM domain